jgi:hypothetical protein
MLIFCPWSTKSSIPKVAQAGQVRVQVCRSCLAAVLDGNALSTEFDILLPTTVDTDPATDFQQCMISCRSNLCDMLGQALKIPQIQAGSLQWPVGYPESAISWALRA